MKDMSIQLNASLDNLAQVVKDNMWALEAAKSEINYLKRELETASSMIKNAYVTNDGEVLDLNELSKRFADWEFRFTDDHR